MTAGPARTGGTSDQRHPEHGTMVRSVAGVTLPVPPMQARSAFARWLDRRACHRAGGHWWHPADPMIAWFCCQCGAERDGMPQDGAR